MPEPSQSVGPNLPVFQPDKIYILSGKTLNLVMKQIKRETPKVITGGGLTIDKVGDDGTYLNIDVNAILRKIANGNSSPSTLALQVCIGGVTKTVNFVVQGSPT